MRKQRLRHLAVGGANDHFHAHVPSTLVLFDRTLDLTVSYPGNCICPRVFGEHLRHCVFFFFSLNMDAESGLVLLVQTIYWLSPAESHTDAHTQGPRLSTTRLWRAINLPFASGQQL